MAKFDAFDFLYDLRDDLLTAEQHAALAWLPEDGSPRDRGSATNDPRPSKELLLSMAPWQSGDPTTDPTICCILCEQVTRLDHDREFDEHWRLTPLGKSLARSIKLAAKARKIAPARTEP